MSERKNFWNQKFFCTNFFVQNGFKNKNPSRKYITWNTSAYNVYIHVACTNYTLKIILRHFEFNRQINQQVYDAYYNKISQSLLKTPRNSPKVSKHGVN